MSKMGSAEIKVEIIHKETITPSSPTPHHLKNLSLSVIDQLMPQKYVPLILFYPTNEANIDNYSLVQEKTSLLKVSLSETLAHFYPFAGTFQYNSSISCDDHGAAFIEARVNCPISKIMEKQDLGMLKHLCPTDINSTQDVAGHLLLVQANFFECGGLAIGVNFSHKVADAFTFSTFVKIWAAIALASHSSNDHDHLVLPSEFGTPASLFPPLDFLNSPQPHVVVAGGEKCTTRRLVFDASSIAALKSTASSSTVPNPTRVEVVSSLIWKCAMEASRSRFGSTRPSSWLQAINMRKRSGMTLTEGFMGNFVWFSTAMTVESELVDVQNLVAKFRKCMDDYKVKYPNGITMEHVLETLKEGGIKLTKEGVDSYTCTSWCRLPFFETNFGWGKPSWVTICGHDSKNSVLLMDVKEGDGVEAVVTFLEEDMAIFESNPELLAYATLKRPTAIF